MWCLPLPPTMHHQAMWCLPLPPTMHHQAMWCLVTAANDAHQAMWCLPTDLLSWSEVYQRVCKAGNEVPPNVAPKVAPRPRRWRRDRIGGNAGSVATFAPRPRRWRRDPASVDAIEHGLTACVSMISWPEPM
jgi:hypothetical protein